MQRGLRGYTDTTSLGNLCVRYIGLNSADDSGGRPHWESCLHQIDDLVLSPIRYTKNTQNLQAIEAVTLHKNEMLRKKHKVLSHEK